MAVRSAVTTPSARAALSHLAAAGGFFCVLALSSLRAQATQGCTGCSIHRSLVVTIGGPSVPVSIGPPIVRLSDGRLIAMTKDQTHFVEFSSTGRFLRCVERPGQRTGDRVGVGASTLGRGDTIVIHEVGRSPNGPQSRLDLIGPSLSVARSLTGSGLPMGIAGLFALSSGGFVSFYGGRDVIDFLSVVNPGGTEVRSFGSVVPRDSACGLCQVRLFAPAQNPAEFLAIPPNEYAIERWSVEGQLLQRIAISSTWFPKGRTPQAPQGSRPNPVLGGVSRDEAGRLWVEGLVANERWKAPAPAECAGRVGPVCIPAPGTPIDVSGYTTVVDALDPTTGAVLATASFDGEASSLLPGGYAVRRRQDADGSVFFDIWKLDLTRSAGDGLTGIRPERRG